jgi:hypothetical protein
MSLMKTGLFLASALAVALPLAGAFAQSDDATYCQALAQQVRTVNRGADPSSAVGGALAQCQSGTPPYGIPTMEKFLTDAKVSLPPRPSMAPPPPPFNAKAYRNTAECLTAAYAAKAPLNLCTGK